MSEPTKPARGGPRLLPALLLVAATILCYAPSLPGEFIWDDDMNVTQNETLRDVEGLGELWIPQNTPQYYPLTFSVFWLQYQLWELEPAGYHLVNLLLHALNALLLWKLLARIGARGAGLAAALFALHPLQVESVAWVMELKNVLSGTFYLLAAGAYLNFDESRESGESGAGSYALTLVLFVAALLSKSVTSTLPAALILVLLFRRRALDARRLVPLAPLFVVGIGLALHTAHIERVWVGAQGHEFVFSAAERVLIASRALLFYPAKLLAPWPLLFNYPRWELDPSALGHWWSVAAVTVLALVALLAYRRGARGPALAAAFFAGSAIPALGFVTYYPMLFAFVADHFVYLPCVGVLLLVAAGWTSLVTRLAWPRPALLVPAVLAGALTLAQSAHFADAQTLYRHTLAHNPDSWLCQSELGALLLRRGRELGREQGAAELAEARTLLANAVARKDDHFMIRWNNALLLSTIGENAAALEHARRAAELRESWAEPPALAAVLLHRMGRTEEAEVWSRRALKADPEHFTAHLFLADRTRTTGRAAEAAEHYAAAWHAAPNDASVLEAGLKYAWFLSTVRDTDLRDGRLALEVLGRVESISGPGIGPLARVRAAALAESGDPERATRLLSELRDALLEAGGPLPTGLEAQLSAHRRGAPWRE
ncbi:MAG: hypothetical protein CMJ84_10375 [Planctomycetes bacterium]|jgi:tetratricopeptide (TPR) repeat protein|nr:hypothetical protein [Planctomycetota bacterium]MDP6409384.1 tetratricopeptide repeat protein [Planctomycetota bacterium]